MLALTACGDGGSKANRSEVVFAAIANGNTDIYRVDDESGAPIRLTNAAGDDFAPAWSPKKDSIAFLSSRNGAPALWFMDWNGESKRQISEAGTVINDFRWAPDSKSIGIEIANGNLSWIAVLDIETEEVEPLTSRSENAKIGDWSPDGEWLLYAAVGGESTGIRRRNPNGVDEITVTTGLDTNPRWSPDGRSIAFNRVTGADGNSSIDLVVSDRDGEKQTNVAPDDFDETSFDWAPDSKRILFVSESSGNAEIYTVAPDGKDMKQLTSNRVIDANPRWNSNGSSILFLSEGDGSYDIYSMNKDGEQQKRMTSIADAILEADW
jgi:TolB protein